MARTTKVTNGINGVAKPAPKPAPQEDDLRTPGRWMLVDAAGTPVLIAGRHVLINSGLMQFARLLVARWLISKGVDIDEADQVRVTEWKPNGWLPRRAVILGATANGVSERAVELAVGG